MKITKAVRSVFVLILIVLLGIVVAFGIYGGKAIRIGIETGATGALGVPVTVDAVDLSILSGKAGLKGLVVGNPAGYQHIELLSLGNGRVELKLSSVFSETVLIDEILLERISVVLEQKGLSNNIQEVIEGISSSAKGPAEKAPPAGDSKEPGKNLHITKLQINDASVKVKLLPVPGKADTLTLNLSPITMENLGTDGKLDIAALSSKILLAITGGILEKGSGVLPQQILGPLNSELEKLGALSEAVLQETDKLLDTGKKAAEDVVGAGKKAAEGADKLKKQLEGFVKPSDTKKLPEE